MNLFLISSTIQTPYGVFSPEVRLQQTFETINSIRSKVPNVKIAMYDSSPTVLSDSVVEQLLSKVDVFLPLQNEQDIMYLSQRGIKSSADALSTYKTLIAFKTAPELQEYMKDVSRIFKISGRYRLQDTFDIKAYDDTKGKYVFRRHPSWMDANIQAQTGVDYLLITRLYSLCTTLLDDYIDTLPAIIDDTLTLGLDIEHCVYKNINKEKLLVFDKIHLEGFIASNGATEID